MNKSSLLAIIVVIGLAVVAMGFFFNRGYGKVSPRTYECATALYGACLAKSEERIAKVEALFDEPDTEEIPSTERVWLERIIEQAKRGEWKKASAAARRMMEDQVER